ncbi:uncharacterized protein B0H18DRAFT_956998 [Fomitopsis serialis]|uniref:uncharacterized protein n=1 Tax=Fomitopsis serialis TaxID=139415 RepID=UPI002007CD20|nr:uncharacterized protein B0H18DRAFT_956998 [Neoantrodia serialis]KAH9920614.1 hypothetical protein B0H18DRAFT_956998 [Neoantrodia serialis]
MASTTSYDYWWPYPAWGATTVPPPVSTAPSSSATTLAPSLVTISATGSSLSSAVHPVATSATSTTSSVSTIRITALPPSNGTSSQKSSVYTHSGFDIAYLAPLFAVLAAIAGALFTWSLLRWQARRRDKEGLGSSGLHTGPRYAPPGLSEGVPQGSSNSESTANESSNLLHGRTDSKKGGWVARAFSRSSRQSQAMPGSAPITPVTAVGRQRSARVPNTPMNNAYSAVDDDHIEDSGAMLVDSHERQRSGTRLDARVASPELLSPGSDDVPYETLRQKSIRRAIIERLKFGTLRRPAKVKTEDILTSKAVACRTRLGHGADLRFAEHGRLLDTNRLEEASEVGTPAHENPAWKWIASWSPSPSIRTEDSYTALPVRRSPTKRAGPVAATPSLPRTDEYPSVAPALSRVDSSILPSSPPQVMSPPLHSKLFFSDFGSPPSLDLHVPKEHHSTARWPASTPERRRLLPYRGKLKKYHAVPMSPPMPSSPKVVALYHPQHVLDFPASPALDQRVYAEMLISRQSALDKVGEIVSRGLSQRDLANVPGNSDRKVEPLPGLTEDRVAGMDTRDGVSAATGHGIEQRLGLLRASESASIDLQ